MRLAPSLVAVTLALTLAACADGTAGPGPTGAQTEVDTSQSEASATPVPEEPTPTDTGTPFDPEEFASRLEAAVDEHPTVRIDVEVLLGEQTSATAKGVQDLASNALDMQVDLSGQQLGYRLVDGQYYLAQPPKWVPVTEGGDNPLIQQTLQQIQILSMRNQLDAFLTGLQAAGVKGEEQVDGVTTTHYTATVDAAQAMAELSMEKAPETPETVIYNVWLDDEDLIRKMSFTQAGASATLTATDWGEPVTIATPQDSELAEAPSAGTP